MSRPMASTESPVPPYALANATHMPSRTGGMLNEHADMFMLFPFEIWSRILMPDIGCLYAPGMLQAPLPSDSLATFQRFMSINHNFHNNVRDHMQNFQEYNKAVKSLSMYVPETRIPCRIEYVEAPPHLDDFDDFVELFENTKTPTPNGIFVGGIYVPVSDDADPALYTTWEHPDNDVASTTNKEPLRKYYVTVCIEFWVRQFTLHLPRPTKNTVDVRGMPNSVRSVLGLHDPTCSRNLLRHQRDNIPCYMRLVQVDQNKTMNDIFDSVAYVEGWSNMGNTINVELPLPIGILDPQCFVETMFSEATSQNVPICPRISWLDSGIKFDSENEYNSEDSGESSDESQYNSEDNGGSSGESVDDYQYNSEYNGEMSGDSNGENSDKDIDEDKNNELSDDDASGS